MMTFTHILLLALVQGLTEFLPVSSSGHLQLIHSLTPLGDQGVVMDIAVHFGTLIAVVFYLRKQVSDCLAGSVDILARRKSTNAMLVWRLIVASLPVLIGGAVLVMMDLVDILRNPEIVAYATILFAVPLYLADTYTSTSHTTQSRGMKGAVIIGLSQIAGLIPGASRAGVTITAARGLGIDREDAARFSMLLSIPVIAAFTLFGLIDLLASNNTALLGDAILAAALSAIAALFSMHWFLRMTQSLSFLPFVLYRLVLGGGLLMLI